MADGRELVWVARLSAPALMGISLAVMAAVTSSRASREGLRKGMSEVASTPARTKVGTFGLRSGSDGGCGLGIRTPLVRQRKATFSSTCKYWRTCSILSCSCRLSLTQSGPRLRAAWTVAVSRAFFSDLSALHVSASRGSARAAPNGRANPITTSITAIGRSFVIRFPRMSWPPTVVIPAECRSLPDLQALTQAFGGPGQLWVPA